MLKRVNWDWGAAGHLVRKPCLAEYCWGSPWSVWPDRWPGTTGRGSCSHWAWCLSRVGQHRCVSSLCRGRARFDQKRQTWFEWKENPGENKSTSADAFLNAHFWVYKNVTCMSGLACIKMSNHCYILLYFVSYRQLRARRALLNFKDVPLRTRRALSLYKVFGDSALLVLNGTSLNSDSTLLILNWQYVLWKMRKQSQIKCSWMLDPDWFKVKL